MRWLTENFIRQKQEDFYLAWTTGAIELCWFQDTILLQFYFGTQKGRQILIYL